MKFLMTDEQAQKLQILRYWLFWWRGWCDVVSYPGSRKCAHPDPMEPFFTFPPGIYGRHSSRDHEEIIPQSELDLVHALIEEIAQNQNQASVLVMAPECSDGADRKSVPGRRNSNEALYDRPRPAWMDYAPPGDRRTDMERVYEK